MENWNIRTLDVQPHHPQILRSGEDGRAIVLSLPGGELLQEHRTRESAYLCVLDGEVEIEHDGEVVTAGAGHLAFFAAHEDREVRASTDARLVMILTPWPAPDHQTHA